MSHSLKLTEILNTISTYDAREDEEKLEHLYLDTKIENDTSTEKNLWKFLTKLKIHLIYEQPILNLHTYPT